MILERISKSSEAEAEYRKALAILQNLADDNPAAVEFRYSPAMCHSNLSDELHRAGKRDESRADQETAGQS
jgi:hypothetical protein